MYILPIVCIWHPGWRELNDAGATTYVGDDPTIDWRLVARPQSIFAQSAEPQLPDLWIQG
jgi:hypothetical protein